MTEQAWVEIARDDSVITQHLDGSEQYRFVSVNDHENVVAFFKFQEGNPAENVNGITFESLLEVITARLDEIAKTELDNTENSRAFDLISEGRDVLYSRIQRRKEQSGSEAFKEAE